MASIKAIRKKYGVVLQIVGKLNVADVDGIEQWFQQRNGDKTPLFFDLQEIIVLDKSLFELFISNLRKHTKKGLSIHLVHVRPELRALVQTTPDDLLRCVDTMDEAVFPFRKAVNPQTDIIQKLSQIVENCPKCKQDLRPGAHTCIHCGHVLHPRRSKRFQVSIPFLYGALTDREFLNSDWKGGISEDIDLQSFSGVGFFCPASIQHNTELHFIFPTLQWNAKESQQEQLTIFCGRVKHCASVDEWFRIGVALYDFFQYQGRFDFENSK